MHMGTLGSGVIQRLFGKCLRRSCKVSKADFRVALTLPADRLCFLFHKHEVQPRTGLPQLARGVTLDCECSIRKFDQPLPAVVLTLDTPEFIADPWLGEDGGKKAELIERLQSV